MKKDVVKRILLVLGLVFLILSFVLKGNLIRVLINLLGVILFTCGISIDKKRYFYILFFLIFLFFSVTIDSIIAIKFVRIPIYSYNTVISNNNVVYNALGYRVWNCEGMDLKVDPQYKLGYYCDASKMDATDINVFLSEVVDNYDRYKNNYIKINGKISKKEGNSYIELQSYQASDITLNGFVNFSDNVTLRVVFKGGEDALSTYDIYDSITVVGKIWYLKYQDNKYTVYMDDSKLDDIELLGNYEMIVSSNSNCQLDKTLIYNGSDYNVFTHCLDNIIVKYDENTKYEIGSVLSSGKLKITDLIDNNITVSESDDKVSKIYEFDNYKILMCSVDTGSDIVIGDMNLSFEDGYCGVVLDEEE